MTAWNGGSIGGVPLFNAENRAQVEGAEGCVPKTKLDRLIQWVADAAYDCGEWDSDDENHTYEELHGESLKAQAALRDYLGSSLTLTPRDIFAIEAGLEVGRGVIDDDEEPWPGIDAAAAKIKTVADALRAEGKQMQPETSAQSQAFIDGASPWPYPVDGCEDVTAEDLVDSTGVLGALNAQREEVSR